MQYKPSITLDFYYVRYNKSNIYFSGPSCDFIKVHERSEGVVTDCPHVGGGAGFTFDGCQVAAKKNNANAFSWRDGQCYYKKCEDVNDLKLREHSTGYEVYKLPCEGGEDPHII